MDGDLQYAVCANRFVWSVVVNKVQSRSFRTRAMVEVLFHFFRFEMVF